MLGAGHGGCESILVGVAAILALVQMMVWRHKNTFDPINEDTNEKMQKIVAEYWALPWYGVLTTPVERVFAMVLHMSLSNLVWQGFVSATVPRIRWLLVAITFHSAVDAVAYYTLVAWNVYIVDYGIG